MTGSTHCCPSLKERREDAFVAIVEPRARFADRVFQNRLRALVGRERLALLDAD